MSESSGRETEQPVTEIDTLLRKVASAPAMMPPLVQGTRIGDAFEIVRPLGAGGMGVVYEAKDLTLDRRVAIKLHQRPDAAMQAMLREAQTMARVRHPNVVTVHAVGFLEHQGSASSVNRMRLQQIVEQTGGQAFFPTRLEDLDRAYAGVVDEIRGQYHLGYVSTNIAEDGAWRKVDIKVSRPDLKVRARKGYFARYRPSPQP